MAKLYNSEYCIFQRANILSNEGRQSSNLAAIAVARAAGQAVATAHMADHELGAAAYAIWSVMKSVSKFDAIRVAEAECRWQQAQLSNEIRELVRSDQQNRNPKFKNVFSASPPSFYQATSD